MFRWLQSGYKITLVKVMEWWWFWLNVEKINKVEAWDRTNWLYMAIINILITMCQMKMWKLCYDVHGITHDHVDLHLVSALWSFIAKFHLIMYCSSSCTTLQFWFTLTTLIELFSPAAGSYFQRKSSDEQTVQYSPSAERQTDTVWD